VSTIPKSLSKPSSSTAPNKKTVLCAGISDGFDVLQVDWSDILWAAVTVGRPNRQYVFRHGQSSQYEALFRWSLVRMALQQSGSAGRRLRRTDAAKSLDPTEKGAVNYFLGMVMCKMFALRLLNVPWLLHLDVFRPQLNPVLNGRSRPDLIGEMSPGQWLALESKGRVSPPDRTTKDKAKDQALRCLSVNGQPVSLHIGAVAYFKNDSLRFCWEDPKPHPEEPRNGFRLRVSSENVWRFHYLPVLELLQHGEATGTRLSEDNEVKLDNLDVTIGLAPEVFKLLKVERWAEAKAWCREHHELLTERDYFPDGVRIVVGDLWPTKFDEAS
ncbi:MAG: hypothetical protein O2960_28585, partial [Verrucomicrobia bacterium]|nr:hypothetical protein [Verrucomicrobiota bacterium]